MFGRHCREIAVAVVGGFAVILAVAAAIADWFAVSFAFSK